MIYYKEGGIVVRHGKMETELVDCPDNHFDSCVTDPPYGLKFMGKKWDYDVPSVDQWKEVYRVMKPGAFLLSFGGTRTYHRMVVNIEDAGFEIRDMIQWIYGSGFPKSLNIGKAVDKLQGNERERILVPTKTGNSIRRGEGEQGSTYGDAHGGFTDIGKGTSEWEGWGTALKPANEPICLARKPLSEKTVALNVLKWGTGGINVDGCRVGMSNDDIDMLEAKSSKSPTGKKAENVPFVEGVASRPNLQGRFPANVIHDGSEEVVGLFPGTKSPATYLRSSAAHGNIDWNPKDAGTEQIGFGDSGSAARFFYCAKASKSERGQDNKHPTVKPLKLMTYLCRLVTPPEGKILDPFLGSGTTALAGRAEGYRFVGIENDIEACLTAKKRLEIK